MVSFKIILEIELNKSKIDKELELIANQYGGYSINSNNHSDGIVEFEFKTQKMANDAFKELSKFLKNKNTINFSLKKEY